MTNNKGKLRKNVNHSLNVSRNWRCTFVKIKSGVATRRQATGDESPLTIQLVAKVHSAHIQHLHICLQMFINIFCISCCTMWQDLLAFCAAVLVDCVFWHVTYMHNETKGLATYEAMAKELVEEYNDRRQQKGRLHRCHFPLPIPLRACAFN